MQIEKILTANDVGKTGAHQAGICVPKKGGFLDFFPKLDVSEKNPRSIITFTDESGGKWKFNFIYYNNKFFGGTRNEYRLTGMTKFFFKQNLKINDKIILKKSNTGDYFINYNKPFRSGTIILSNTWKILDL